MHIARLPTIIVDMEPVVASLEPVEVHHDGAWGLLDALAPALLAPG